MIYAGFINYNSLSIPEENLTKAIGSFTQNSPFVIKKGALVLSYGKLSATQDVDGIWENDSSILIGRVFDKERSCALKNSTFKELSFLNKEAALSKAWGKYVYINVNKKNSQVEIVVDSTGQLPFFYYIFSDGNIVFSSDIEIIFKVLMQRPEYNWSYLCSYVIYGNSSSIQTPFKNVFELPPACSLTINKTIRKTEPFWNPLCSYHKPEHQEKNAVSVLKETLNPWMKPYKNIYVSLSGGLDSSSLVYCLKNILKKNQTLKAINFFHSQIKSSNELPYARKVCEETGIELIEIDASDSLPFDSPHRKPLIKLNKPFPGMISLRWMETICERIPSDEPFGFVSGHGSDHIFMRPPSKKSTVDYLLKNGARGYKGQLEEIAQFYRDPLFSIFRENITSLWSHFFAQRAQKRSPQNIFDEIPPWIKQEVHQKKSGEFVHPIYEYLPSRIPPGKYDQIDSLYEGLSSIHVPMENQIDPTYYPFLYQPVVEFALSFPTYELFEKGYDRYPLRKSVSETFRTDTVWRRDKSQTTGIFQLGIKRNLDKVLSLCLEGQFAKKGFIDKAGLQNTINLIGNGDTKYMWPFMHIASVELFLRQWEEKVL
jgi:asparagine synthase (glutamine-hydrolysing)